MKKITLLIILFALIIAPTMAATYLRDFSSNYEPIPDSSKIYSTMNLPNGKTAFSQGFLKGWGIYDAKGVYIQPQFKDIRELKYNSQNYLAVKRYEYWGTIDFEGREIIPIDFDELQELTRDYCAVLKNGLWGWVDYKGNIIKKPEFTGINKIDDYLVGVCKETGCGVVKLNSGEIVFPLINKYIFGGFKPGYFTISSNGRYGLIDRYTHTIIPCRYTELKSLDDNVIMIKNEKLCGLVTIAGKILTEPKYSKIETLNQNGYYKIKLDNKWGAMNYDGDIVFECKYGPLEINKKVKEYSGASKYTKIALENYYYNLFEKAAYSFFVGAYNDGKNCAKKILNSNEASTEIKTKANELLKQYKISL